jgi:hypothetical protein
MTTEMIGLLSFEIAFHCTAKEIEAKAAFLN